MNYRRLETNHSKIKEEILVNFIKRNTFQRPVLTGIILALIALIFRLIDISVLRLDERLGEIILSKALGFFLVISLLMMVVILFVCRRRNMPELTAWKK